MQKHAHASHVDVTLETAADHVLLAIVDDGVGIGPDAHGKAQSHGLAGMKHRIVALGGTLTVGRPPEGGTEVRAMVPHGIDADACGADARTPAASDARRLP